MESDVITITGKKADVELARSRIEEIQRDLVSLPVHFLILKQLIFITRAVKQRFIQNDMYFFFLTYTLAIPCQFKTFFLYWILFLHEYLFSCKLRLK